MAIKIGDKVLKSFNPDKPRKNLEHGGWSGIVIFEDTATGERIVNRTMSLTTYLKGINFNTVKKGQYGEAVSKMSYAHIKVYYYSLASFSEIRAMQNYFRREITKAKKPVKLQQELNFTAKVKKIIKKPNVTVTIGNEKPNTLINAFVTDIKHFEPFEQCNPIGITYIDDKGFRCTMFVVASTTLCTNRLVDLINKTVK